MSDIFFKYYSYIIILIIFSSIMLGVFLVRKKNRYRIKSGEKILKKIRLFDGENYESRVISYLRKIDPFTFEELLLSLFKESGCKIKRNKRYTGDGGIDGRFSFNNKNYFIQAKRYSKYIKASDVIDFADLCSIKKVNGLFIHTGLTGKSIEIILENNSHIIMIDSKQLVNFIKSGTIKISN